MEKGIHGKAEVRRGQCRAWLGIQVIERLHVSHEHAQDLTEAALARVEAQLGLGTPGNATWNAGALRILNLTLETVRARQLERMHQPSCHDRNPAAWRSPELSAVDGMIELEEAPERARKGHHILQAFASLPSPTRQILDQVVIRRRSIRDVARRLRIPRTTLYERLINGIRQLHDRFCELQADGSTCNIHGTRAAPRKRVR